MVRSTDESTSQNMIVRVAPDPEAVAALLGRTG
jgi:hypothetical protein